MFWSYKYSTFCHHFSDVKGESQP